MTIELDKYAKQAKEYDIIGLKVHPKPLKLRWKILFQPLSIRLTAFTKKESGLTEAEFSDPQYSGFLKIFEAKFFSKNFNPNPEIEKAREEEFKKITADFLSQTITEEEKQKKLDAAVIYYKHVPSGKENLAELLSALIQEDIDWNKFIMEHLEQYDEIRKAGMSIYEDFFTEIYELKKT